MYTGFLRNTTPLFLPTYKILLQQVNLLQKQSVTCEKRVMNFFCDQFFLFQILFQIFRVETLFRINNTVKKKEEETMTDLVSDHLMSGMLDSQAPGLASDIPPTPADANMEVDDTPTPRTTRRPGFEPDNIPRVIDETAMAVMETFEKFLET